MKVCVISLESLPVIAEEFKVNYVGGAQVQLAQLAAALGRQGVDVSMIVSDLGQPDGAVYSGIPTLKAFAPDAGLPGVRFFHPRATLLWNSLLRADADVYICSTASIIVGLLALFCRVHGRRFIFRVASDSDCDPSQLLIGNRRDRWIYQAGLRRANDVFVQSEVQKALLLKNYARHGRLARSFVERPLTPLSEMVKDVDVLWVSNIRQLKRVDRMLEIAQQLPQFSFHIVGGPVDGEEPLFTEMQQRAREVPNVTYHGPVPYPDVGPFFDRARLLVNTSEIEGFPNTFLQAWIRGVPVVTMFDPDGVVVKHSLGTMHASAADAALGVRQLLTDPPTYARFGRNALDYMELKYAERDIVRPYMEFFDGR